MATLGRDPERWEEGCRQDDVRNRIVVPDLLDRLNRIGPRLIADVGSGTGYVSRVVAERYPHKDVRWVLLENDPHMLQFSADLTAGQAGIEPIPYDILGVDDGWVGRFDFAFSCFSSLDFGMGREIANKILRLLRVGGTFVFYLPDLLEDVAQICSQEGGVDQLHAYRRGATPIRKPDRFTERMEPFTAHRIEHCISYMLAAGALMSEMRFIDRTADRCIVAMEFMRIA